MKSTSFGLKQHLNKFSDSKMIKLKTRQLLLSLKVEIKHMKQRLYTCTVCVRMWQGLAHSLFTKQTKPDTCNLRLRT